MGDIIKALTEAETGTPPTGGGVLIPEEIDKDVRTLLDVSAPLRVLLPRIPWSTNSYEWDDRTALMYGGFFLSSDQFGQYSGVDKTAEQQSTYVRRSALMYRLKVEGNVDKLLRKAAMSFQDAVKLEVEAATLKMRLVEEDAFLRATTPTDGFSPMYIQITQNVNANGAIMSFDILDSLISKVTDQGFEVDLIIMAPRDLAKLRKEIRDKGKVDLDKVKVAEIASLVDAYNGIRLITSPKVPTNLTYGGTPTGTMSVAYAVNTKLIRVPVLQDVSYEEVVVSTDSLAFRFKEYIAFVVIGGGIAHAKLINIAAS